MSRAFVKEPDGADAYDEVPEKIVSEHPNLVTRTGLGQIETEVARLSEAYAKAQAAGERAALAVIARDLRYWSARKASAELMPEPKDASEVRFGARVTFLRSDGRRQTFQIVGEDEADPAKGTLSYVAPLARALLGRSIGDEIAIPSGHAEIVAIM